SGACQRSLPLCASFAMTVAPLPQSAIRMTTAPLTLDWFSLQAGFALPRSASQSFLPSGAFHSVTVLPAEASTTSPPDDTLAPEPPGTARLQTALPLSVSIAARLVQ